MNTYEFCTLFDVNYLTRGLALHASLMRHCQNFRLWILCLCEESFDILSRLSLPNVTLIRLADLEDVELLRAKQNRDRVEYYWTLTPSLPRFILAHHPEIPVIAYLDADLFFYSSPQAMYDELGARSIYIIPHRHPPYKKNVEAVSGKFNVGMLIFRNDLSGRQALEWWRERNNEWCYRTPDNEGRIGDQKYLEEFPDRFSGVVISQHIGACVAPWNVRQYAIQRIGETVMIDRSPLIFYHFHHFEIYPPAWLQPRAPLSHYTEPGAAYAYIYCPYFSAIHTAARLVRTIEPNFTHGYAPRPGPLVQWIKQLHTFCQRLAMRLLGNARYQHFFSSQKWYRFRSWFFHSRLLHSSAREAYRALRAAEKTMRKSFVPILTDTNGSYKQFILPQWQRYYDAAAAVMRKRVPMNFLCHTLMREAMSATSAGDWQAEELRFLEERFSRETLSDILRESPIGHPIITDRNYRTSHNTIHLFYHLNFFAKKTNTDLSQIQSIVEWGGGYGNLARLFLQLQPNATYTIIDLPIFSYLQAIYLAATIGEDRVHVVTRDDSALHKGKVNVVPLDAELLHRIAFPACDLFVSTWALSESNAFAQKTVASLDFFHARHLLFASQKASESFPYAEKIISHVKNFHVRYHESIPFIKGESSYLFCTRLSLPTV